jgi:hypothetical protein
MVLLLGLVLLVVLLQQAAVTWQPSGQHGAQLTGTW